MAVQRSSLMGMGQPAPARAQAVAPEQAHANPIEQAYFQRLAQAYTELLQEYAIHELQPLVRQQSQHGSILRPLQHSDRFGGCCLNVAQSVV